MIDEYKYGMFTIDGKLVEDDIKLLGTRLRYWECRNRTVSLKDVNDIFAFRPELVIFGLGAGGLISVADQVKDALHDKNIRFVEKKNADACTLYNDALKEGKSVVAVLPARG
jgi:hypothetical protein